MFNDHISRMSYVVNKYYIHTILTIQEHLLLFYFFNHRFSVETIEVNLVKPRVVSEERSATSNQNITSHPLSPIYHHVRYHDYHHGILKEHQQIQVTYQDLSPDHGILIKHHTRFPVSVCLSPSHPSPTC